MSAATSPVQGDHRTSGMGEVAAGDTFTRDLFAWQAQVLADRGLTLLALHVALVIGQYVNRQTGEAWPSQETIAAALATTSDHVRKVVRQLVAHSHLTVAVRHGRGDSNRYRLVLKTQPIRGVFDERNPADGMGIRTENPAIRRGIEKRNPADRAEETQPIACPNHLREPSEEDDSISAPSKPKRRPPTPKAKTSDADFHAFWLQVPKAVGKDDARRAYDKAILSGRATHAELLSGMLRYASERRGEDPRFTKHPATWVNKGCWHDAPAQSQPSAQEQPMTRAQASRAEAREALREIRERAGAQHDPRRRQSSTDSRFEIANKFLDELRRRSGGDADNQHGPIIIDNDDQGDLL